MLDVSMFIFVHSIVDLVSDFHIDVCGLMVSLLVCAGVGPCPPPGHQRQVVTVPPMADPFGSSRRWQWDMDGMVLYMEEVATGVSDVGWKHMNTNFIAAVHNLLPELMGVMRNMAVACEHFRWTARGGVLALDSSSSEDDESELD